MWFRSCAIIAGFLTLPACGGAASSETDTGPVERSSTAAQPDSVSDLPGDAVMASTDPAPGYLDLLGAGVVRQDDGAFVLSMALAEPVPHAPKVQDPYVALGWSFCLDTDPDTAAPGFPLATIPMPCEFIVHTRWNGSKISGVLIDRRPLVGGGDAETFTMDPAIDDAGIIVTVPSAQLDDPSSFSWSAFTEELGPFGTDLVSHADAVPDGGIDDPVAWPTG